MRNLSWTKYECRIRGIVPFNYGSFSNSILNNRYVRSFERSGVGLVSNFGHMI